MELFKYQGAGNDFLLADGRNTESNLTTEEIRNLCDRHYGIGADGLMILRASKDFGFAMDYFNSDGSGGMMCGNGGRCIVAFAYDLGITNFNFTAPDGPHSAEILSIDGNTKIIRLKMKDVQGITTYDNGKAFFLDTGTRHFVRFISGIEDYNVFEEGRKIRYRSEFAPIGTNANFAEYKDNSLIVRTYEKGVEAETLACGTGIVASAIAAYIYGIPPRYGIDGSILSYDIQALKDRLSVEFTPTADTYTFSNIYLTGPAAKVAKILV